MAAPRILVTGAAGFTGRHLGTAAAARGMECVGLVYGEPADIPGYAATVQCDITDQNAVAAVVKQWAPNFVVHLAGIAFVAHGSARQIYDTNLWGSISLLDALSEHGSEVERVLVASSGNVYGSNQRVPITEDAAPEPANDYGVSKFAMEHACRLRLHKLPITIARPFNYTGIGQDPNFLIPKMVNAFRARQPVLELGNLDVARDFSDVRDVVDAYLDLLSEPGRFPVYNVCSGAATALATVIEQLKALADHEIEIRVNPAFVRSNEIKELYGDRSRLDEAIGERQRHTLQDTLQWMLSADS